MLARPDSCFSSRPSTVREQEGAGRQAEPPRPFPTFGENWSNLHTPDTETGANAMDLITPDALPTDPIDALRELVRCEGEIERLRWERIKEARSAGASWKQVGEVLGMTERSAWEYFTRSARTAIADTAEENEALGEADAVDISVEEARAIRRRRSSI